MFRIIKKSFSSKTDFHSKIVIIGAGAGGSAISKLLTNYKYNFNPSQITIIEPSNFQMYQPGYTLIGSDKLSRSEIMCTTKWSVKRGVDIVYDSVTKVVPKENYVETTDNNKHYYEHLIICSGIHPIYDNVKGLKEALDDPNCPIGTIFDINYSEKYRKLRNNFTGGNAIFGFPHGVLKCPGAPLKILMTSTYDWIQKGIPYDAEYISAAGKIFGVDHYIPELEKAANERNIKRTFNSKLVEVDKDNRIATYVDGEGKQFTRNFDIMHVGVAHKPSDYLANCKEITDDTGMLSVNKETMQSDKFDNIWGFGDCTNIPTGKTQSAVNDQMHYLVHNFYNSYHGRKDNIKRYTGYTACPLFLGGRQLVLAEFGFNGKPIPTFLNNQQKPNPFFWFLKEHVFHRMHVLGFNHYIKNIRHLVKKISRTENDKFFN